MKGVLAVVAVIALGMSVDSYASGAQKNRGFEITFAEGKVMGYARSPSSLDSSPRSQRAQSTSEKYREEESRSPLSKPKNPLNRVNLLKEKAAEVHQALDFLFKSEAKLVGTIDPNSRDGGLPPRSRREFSIEGLNLNKYRTRSQEQKEQLIKVTHEIQSRNRMNEQELANNLKVIAGVEGNNSELRTAFKNFIHARDRVIQLREELTNPLQSQHKFSEEDLDLIGTRAFEGLKLTPAMEQKVQKIFQEIQRRGLGKIDGSEMKSSLFFLLPEYFYSDIISRFPSLAKFEGSEDTASTLALNRSALSKSVQGDLLFSQVTENTEEDEIPSERRGRNHGNDCSEVPGTYRHTNASTLMAIFRLTDQVNQVFVNKPFLGREDLDSGPMNKTSVKYNKNK